MPSKMSLFNKEILLQIGRSTGWISVVYLMGLLLALPIKMLMMYSDANKFPEQTKINSLYYYDFTIQMVLFVIIPVLMAVFLFKFLHAKQVTDLMHSLPIRREKIFHHYALSGAVLLVVPVIIIAIVVLCLHAALDLTPYFSSRDVLYWAGMTILLNLVMYTGSVFVAMMTGISAVHAVLSYIFLLFPAGMMILFVYNLKVLFYGFPSDYFLHKDIAIMSPISYAAVLDSRRFQAIVTIVYTVSAVVLYLLALFFYKKRKLEAASEAIAFSKLRLIFKYGVTFCSMMLGGMYFSEVQSGNFGWTIFGYAIGAAVGYFVAEMVLQKTWRVFKAGKGLIVYAIMIGFVLTIVKALGIYENTIPEPGKIKSVLLTDNPGLFLNQSNSYEKLYVPKPLLETNNIEAVRKLHQQIINDKEMNQQDRGYQYAQYGPNDPYQDVFLAYKLKDGRKVIREYRINKLLYSDFFKPIYESKEYKLKSEEIFRVKANKVEYIGIAANGPVNKKVFISDPKDVNQLISLLKTDALAENYEDSTYYGDSGANIEINMGKVQGVSMVLNPSYQKVNAWLKAKGWLEKATITAADVEYALIAKNNFGDSMNLDLIGSKIEKQPGVLKVTNKQQIQNSLDHAGVLNKGKYVTVFRYKQGINSEAFYLDDNHVPDFVKEHYKD